MIIILFLKIEEEANLIRNLKKKSINLITYINSERERERAHALSQFC